METKNYPENTEQVADRALVKPPVDIFENQDGLLLVVDMPGVKAEAVSIDVDKDVLTIVGKRERESFDYKRVFTVPNTIDADRIKADLKAGVLEVHLPRHERSKARRIAINAA